MAAEDDGFDDSDVRFDRKAINAELRRIQSVRLDEALELAEKRALALQAAYGALEATIEALEEQRMLLKIEIDNLLEYARQAREEKQ